MARIDKSEVTRGNILSRFRCRMSIALCGDMEADIRTNHIHIVKWNGTE